MGGGESTLPADEATEGEELAPGEGPNGSSDSRSLFVSLLLRKRVTQRGRERNKG